MRNFVLVIICKTLLIFLGLIIVNAVIAQDSNEIQVYASATVPKKTTIIELHTNYTFTGPKSNTNYHPFLQTLEVTTGLTDNFELGFYVFTYKLNGKTYYTGSNIRPRIKVPEKWGWSFGASLSSEIGFSIDPFTDKKTWGAEIRPIFDKTIGKNYFSINPNIGLSFYDNEALFEPNIKYAYSSSKKVSLGVEYYGNTGKVLKPFKISDQEHQIFFVADLFIHPDYEFNFGLGEGLTSSSNRLNFKCFIGRRINWNKK